MANANKYPAPPALAVPTDLSPKEIAPVVLSLNALVACSVTLYFKCKNYHWHVAGPHFRGYHKLFETCAKTCEHMADSLAERVRRLGGETCHSLSEVMEYTLIKEDTDDLVLPPAMGQRLVQDFGHIAQLVRDAIETAEKSRDLASADKLEEWLGKVEKRKWALFEITQLTGYVPPTQGS